MRAVRRSLLLALALALSLGAAAEAKKGGGNKPFEETITVNAAIPPTPPVNPSIPLTSEIKVPKKFKKKVVGDLNVTGVQTTGTAAAAAEDLLAYLTAPNGRTTFLFIGIGDQSIGPLTMDDDTSTTICDEPPAADCPGYPGATLFQPFAGTANLLANFVGQFDASPLSDFDGIKMRGTWTFSVVDIDDPTNSTLNQWGLRIKPAKPVTD